MNMLTRVEDTAERRMLANAIRMLAVDAVEQAKSGHPGAPMGMADVAEVLWRRHLKHDAAHPDWPDRDRFVLSNGHASMLLYSVLNLTGYDVPLEELRHFRQLHSRTPGHPEARVTPGVETTTGPLGQGLANAVGMALAEKLLVEQFNRPGHTIVDHRTYCFAGDGCLMEGLSHEACSLAGTLGLDKLIVLYDDNGISIDGAVEQWFTDDTPGRFEAYGWRVVRDIDGHDPAAIEAALRIAHTRCGKPTLICCKTRIGYGAPNKAGTEEVHGAPLGREEADATRKALGWRFAPFEIPPAVKEAWDARRKGARAHQWWRQRFSAYAAEYPELAAEFERRTAGTLSAAFAAHADALAAVAAAKREPIATRKASRQAIDALAPGLPELLGGSADLTGSNLTAWKDCRPITRQNGGNYLHYGVREFGMAAVMNGIALHGGYIPFGGTFLVFSDYARNALRLSALMKLRVIYVLTHDSIGLGEDGPTHQPVEHIASLRLMPNMDVWRPCDFLETAVAWRHAIERSDGPTSLILSRQNLASQPGGETRGDLIRCGGYVLADPEGTPQLILIATGSEVGLAMGAQEALARDGIRARVVSMPSTSVFDRQPECYRASVLPRGIRRIAIEAAAPDFWWKYVGLDGAVIGIDRFGESAPGSALFSHFGFTAARIAAAARKLISGS
jgi:transketolase